MERAETSLKIKGYLINVEALPSAYISGVKDVRSWNMGCTASAVTGGGMKVL